jgi:hypothetical protein
MRLPEYWSLRELTDSLKISEMELSKEDFTELEFYYFADGFGKVHDENGDAVSVNDKKRVFFNELLSLNSDFVYAFVFSHIKLYGRKKPFLINSATKLTVISQSIINGKSGADIKDLIGLTCSLDKRTWLNIDNILVESPKAYDHLVSTYGFHNALPSEPKWAINQISMVNKQKSSSKRKENVLYSTKLLEVLDDVINEFWSEDATQGAAKKEVVLDWIRKNYTNQEVSQNMAKAIDTITRPVTEKVKKPSKK